MKVHLVILFLVRLLLVFQAIDTCMIYYVPSCDAKKIDSYDLLIGDWDTSVRLLPSCVIQSLLHRVSSSSSSPQQQQSNKLLDIFSRTDACTTRSSSISETPFSPPPNMKQKRRQYGWFHPLDGHNNRYSSNNEERDSRDIPCRLSLYANGTFGMISNPNPNHNNNHNNMNSNDDKVTTTTTATTTATNHSPLQLMIRGTWTVQTNPYCVTDRFYDDIVLVSYPRTQKVQQAQPQRQPQQQQQQPIRTITQTNNNKLRNDRNSKQRSSNHTTVDIHNTTVSIIKPLQKVQLTLRCRLSGHFTSGTGSFRRRFINNIRHKDSNTGNYYARGTMTHGVMVLEELRHYQQSNDNERGRGMASWWMMMMQQYRRRHSKEIIASFAARRYIPTYSDFFSQSNDSDVVDGIEEEF